MTAVRKRLSTLRTRHGADSPVGHRCSNLIEQLKNYETETDPEAREQLKKNIAKSIAGLAKLTAA